MATEVTLRNLKGQYLNVFRPKKNNITGKEEFSAVILMPKNDPQFQMLQQLMREEANSEYAREKIWKGPTPMNLKFPIKDADLPKSNGNFWEDHEKGHYIITTKLSAEAGRVECVDVNLNQIFSPSDIYSGAWYNWGLTAQAYNVRSNVGIMLKLNAIQKVKDDVPIGYAAPSASTFFGKPNNSNPATLGNNPAGNAPQQSFQQSPNNSMNSMNQMSNNFSSGNQFPNFQQPYQPNQFQQPNNQYMDNPLNQVGQSMEITDQDLPF